MRTISLIFILFIYTLSFGQKKEVSIQFNKNVELVGYIINLAEPTPSDPQHPISILLRKGESDKNLPVLMNIFEIAGNMNYAFAIDLGNDLPEFPLPVDFKVNDFLKQKYSYKSTDEIKTIEDLVSYLNQFAKESKFEEIWLALTSHREEVKRILNDYKPSKELIAEMERVHEQAFSSYRIVPSFTLWPTAGWGFKNEQTKIATFILGPVSENYDFSDAEKFKGLAIHEFGHSFINDVVLESKDIIDETRHLFESLQEQMYPQGYHDWESCMIEHFVRASEIYIPEIMGDTARSEQILKEYVENRKFTYLPFIIKQLKYYRVNEKLSYRAAVRKTLLDVKNHY